VDPQLLARWRPRLKRLAGAVIVILVIGGVAKFAVARAYPGPRQPIPFSHRVHAGLKGISCLFCHPDADRGPYPGLPAVDKCRLCHSVIIPEFRPIRSLHAYKQRNQGVPWVRVNVVPDFVFFHHQIHLSRGIDCGKCHGDVKNMDRIYEVNRMSMGFCVDCHRQNRASTDCWTCHR
jgi:hypothetical protein